MSKLFLQSYIKTRRIIENEQQHYLEEAHELTLYEDKIISSSEQFLLQDVLDISYRSTSDEIGLLYLHTNRGVFTFNVRTNPTPFIIQFEKLKKK